MCQWLPNRSNDGIHGAAGAGTVAVTPALGAGASSAWLGAARPTAVAVIPMISRLPAKVRRRNPLGVVRGLHGVLVWVWFVVVEVFMALIVRSARAPQ
jgi:hypothetical protein